MRFTFAFLGTVGTLLCIVGLLNYIVNPYAMYPTHWFKPAAANDLDRALSMAQNPNLNPELVVLGSSRSSRLLPGDLKCYSGLRSANLAFSNASPDSYFALASYLLENKTLPKMLLIGMDVEGFQDPSKFRNQLDGVPRLQRYAQGGGRIEASWQALTQLFSIAQLNDSAHTVLHIAQSDDDTDAAPASPDTPPVQIIENRDENTAPKALVSYQKKYDGFTALSAEQLKYFESLLALAARDKISTRVFITPMHPQMIEALDKQGFYPGRLADLITWVNTLHAKYAFEFYDFSTLDTFGGNTQDFYNLAHIDEKNSARLIGAMFKDTGRAAQCAPKK